jgi:prepilin-type N-terminal cleavage/methylation domain-containing protein
VRHRNSFTLIEVMVAISIFATVAIVLYSCLRSGILSYKRIEEEARFQQKLRYAFSIITKDIKNTLYMANVPFKGDEEKVMFASALSLQRGAGMNMACVHYYVKDSGQAKTLFRKTEPLAYTLNRLSGQGTGSEEVFSEDAAGYEQIILDDITAIRFSYLSPQPDGFLKEFNDQADKIIYEWVGLWESENRLPAGFRVDVSLKNPTGNEILEFSRRIWIPIKAYSDVAPE